MDSFIRSKYESRRWALEGPPPADPSVLSTEAASAPAPPSAPATPVQQAPTPTRAAHAATNSFSATRSTAAPISTRHQLLSAGIANRPVGVVPTANPKPAAPAPPPAPAPQNDLFSLDFHAPPIITNNNSQSTSPEQKKDVKQDILSLFSAPPPQSAPAIGNGFGQFSGPAQTASPWGAAQAPGRVPPVTSMMGSNGTAMWGASSGWNNAATVMPTQSNVWGAPAAAAIPQQQQPNLFASGNDIWGGSASASVAPVGSQDLFGSFSTGASVQQKKDDAFGDIWGGNR